MTTPTPDRLTEALAEGIHKAMCFERTMHNRLACPRAGVYLAIAEAAVAHPAVVEVTGVQKRSSDAAFGALDAIAGDLDDALATRPGPGEAGLRAASEKAVRYLSDVRLSGGSSGRAIENARNTLAAALRAPVADEGLDGSLWATAYWCSQHQTTHSARELMTAHLATTKPGEGEA